MHITRPTPCVNTAAGTQASTQRHSTIRCSAQPSSRAAQQSRRQSLAAALAGVASLLAGQAQARYGDWDGSSAAIGSCPIGDVGDECRRQALLKDRAAAGSDEDAYAAMTKQGQMGGSIASGVPVSVLDEEYGRSTVAFAELVDKFAALDLYDPERPKVIAQIKKDGATWASKYARGGSARKQAARSMYVAVDALLSHFASNGFAALTPNKLKKIRDNVAKSLELLAAGK